MVVRRVVYGCVVWCGAVRCSVVWCLHCATQVVTHCTGLRKRAVPVCLALGLGLSSRQDALSQPAEQKLLATASLATTLQGVGGAATAVRATCTTTAPDG